MKTTITLPLSPEEVLAERAKSADQEADFIEWFAKNYNGEVVFSDPAWHAKRIWQRAKGVDYEQGYEHGYADATRQAIEAGSSGLHANDCAHWDGAECNCR